MTVKYISWMIVGNHLDKTKVYKYDIITRHNKRGDLDLLTQLNDLFAKREIHSPYLVVTPLISNDDIAPFGIRYDNGFTANECNQTIDRIIDGLKELFPDCLIQIDPLKTYILIDWN